MLDPAHLIADVRHERPMHKYTAWATVRPAIAGIVIQLRNDVESS